MTAMPCSLCSRHIGGEQSRVLSPNGRGGWTPLRPLRGLQETRVATREDVPGVLQARTLEWLPFPSPGDLSNPEIKPVSPALAGGFFTTEPQGKEKPHGQVYAL